MDVSDLASLPLLPFIDSDGQLPEQLQGKVGAYAIFDQSEQIQYVGFSRDVYLSLKQHLVRCPDASYWVKVQLVDRPSRTLLEQIQSTWIAEQTTRPVGNEAERDRWSSPIDAKAQMTADEQNQYNQALDEAAQAKVMKQVARRVEAEILAALQTRGVKVELRFNPKLKEEGLLDLK